MSLLANLGFTTASLNKNSPPAQEPALVRNMLPYLFGEHGGHLLLTALRHIMPQDDTR